MAQANWLIIPLAAFIPLVLGYIWYQPNVMGDRLSKINGAPIDTSFSIKKIVLIYLFSFLLAYILTLMSVHQTAMFQLFFMDPDLADTNSEYSTYIKDFLSKYGDRHRSFGHGMVHGSEAGLMFGLAMLGITTLLQGKPLKSIWIHLLFMIICCTLIGGFVCAYF